MRDWLGRKRRQPDAPDPRAEVIAQLDRGARLAHGGRAGEACEVLLAAWERAGELGCRELFREEGVERALRNNCLLLTEALTDQGRDEQARRLAEWQIVVYGHDFFASYSLGRLAARRGDFAAAVEQYRASLAAEPDTPEVEPQQVALCVLTLAAALSRGGEPEAAVAFLEQQRGARDWPPELAAQIEETAQQLAAGTLTVIANPEEAQQLSVEQLVSEANRLDEAGRFGEARGLYEEALKLAPGEPEVTYNYGVACGGQQRPELDRRAAELYARTLELDPDHLGAHANLGALHLRRNAFAEALPMLEGAVRCGADQPEVFFYLALCQMQTGRRRQALASLETARAKGPDGQLRSQIDDCARQLEGWERLERAEQSTRARPMGGGGMVIESEPPAVASPPDSPLQVMTADTPRELGQALAEAMGKSFVRAQFMTMGAEGRKLFFECEDGEYIAHLDGPSVQIYDNAGGELGRRVHTLPRR